MGGEGAGGGQVTLGSEADRYNAVATELLDHRKQGGNNCSMPLNIHQYTLYIDFDYNYIK